MRSQKLFERQKKFLGMASHELQTPIAATMNRLESILDEETLSEKQTGDLLKAIHSLENMSQLNRSLLMFSKIENGQFNDTQGIDFMKLTEEILPELQIVYRSRKIKVEIHSEAPFVRLIDPTLARMMLTNLLKNAFLHNKIGGNLVVTSRSNDFTISNDGQQPLDANRIFEPFYREQSDKNHDNQEWTSTGIGLALVQTICKQSNLQINYSFEEGRHRFQIC